MTSAQRQSATAFPNMKRTPESTIPECGLFDLFVIYRQVSPRYMCSSKVLLCDPGGGSPDFYAGIEFIERVRLTHGDGVPLARWVEAIGKRWQLCLDSNWAEFSFLFNSTVSR